MSSPQNSTRSGCSSVGGKTSRMPPRTANSPRFSTSSTREYAAAASASTVSPRSALTPVRRTTGSRSPRPLTCGWRTERMGATTTDTGPVSGSSGRGWERRRRTARQPADRVRAGREPLVGQRLPRGVLRDAVRREQGAQGRGQVLGLAARCRHGQYRAAGLAGERGDGERACRRWADQVDMPPVAVGGGLHRLREGGVLDDGVEQTVQAHEGLSVRGLGARAGRTGGRVASAKGPTRETSRGCPDYDGAVPCAGAVDNRGPRGDAGARYDCERLVSGSGHDPPARPSPGWPFRHDPVDSAARAALGLMHIYRNTRADQGGSAISSCHIREAGVD